VKLTFAVLLIAALAALPLAAVTFDTAKFAQATGVRMDGGAKVNIAEGQTLTAKVVNATVLAKLGLMGAKSGEAVEVTLVSLTDKKLKLMHVPSNQAVTLNYSKIEVEYRE
jgi:hypothetical protein